MKTNNNNVVKLLVILGTILAVTVPVLINTMYTTRKMAFESDAKTLLRIVENKILEDVNFDVATINVFNVMGKLNQVYDNYESLSVQKLTQDKLYVKVVGKNKRAGLTACGSLEHIVVGDQQNCLQHDKIGPYINFNPVMGMIPSSVYNITVDISDQSGIDHTGLKYFWSTSLNFPNENKFVNSFENRSAIHTPERETGKYYLWILAKDKLGNITINNSGPFNLDNTAPEITVLGNTTVKAVLGDAYIDEGSTAIDNVDGDITEQIDVISTVNPSVPGKYTVLYSTIDKAGNLALEVRFVNVIE